VAPLERSVQDLKRCISAHTYMHMHTQSCWQVAPLERSVRDLERCIQAAEQRQSTDTIDCKLQITTLERLLKDLELQVCVCVCVCLCVCVCVCVCVRGCVCVLTGLKQ